MAYRPVGCVRYVHLSCTVHGKAYNIYKRNKLLYTDVYLSHFPGVQFCHNGSNCYVIPTCHTKQYHVCISYTLFLISSFTLYGAQHAVRGTLFSKRHSSAVKGGYTFPNLPVITVEQQIIQITKKGILLPGCRHYIE